MIEVLLTMFCAGLGAAFLYCSARSIADSWEGEGPAPICQPWVYAAMAVSCASITAMLALFYKEPWLVILRTLLMNDILWACAWADAKAFLIPNRVVGFGALSSLAVLGIEILLSPGQAAYLLLRTAIAAGALGIGALLCRILSPRSVGMGDVKLLAVMGLCLGMDLVWSALFSSLLVTFVYCVFLLVTKRAKRTDSIPFAPLVLVGTVAAVFLTGV